MTGSSYIPIVVPIMAFVAMALWLGLVFYADGHPGYPRSDSRRAAGADGTVADGTVADGAVAAPGREALTAKGPAGPGEHERINQDAAAGARH